MLSIVTSTGNDLALNMIFWENLKKYTNGPFELIVIDNLSVDGSREFLLDIGAKVIYNHHARKYPDLLLPAINRASGEFVSFLSNSMIVSKDWNSILIKDMLMRQRESIAAFTNNQPCNCLKSKLIYHKWQCYKFLILKLLGDCYSNYKISAKLMYGDWEKWTEKNTGRFGREISTITSSHLICKRSFLKTIGAWIKADNFQFDITDPIHLSREVYFHDFGKAKFIQGNPNEVEKQTIKLDLDLERMKQNILPVPNQSLSLN